MFNMKLFIKNNFKMKRALENTKIQDLIKPNKNKKTVKSNNYRRKLSMSLN